MCLSQSKVTSIRSALTFCTRHQSKPRGAMDPPKKKKKMTKKRGKSTKKLKLPLYRNPWDFIEIVPNLDESLKLNKNDITDLECRLKYTIRCLQDSELYNTDYLYKLFGDQVDRSPKFMRRCVHQYATGNMDWIEQLSTFYLKSIGKTTKNWIQGIKKGDAGNIFDLYMLSKVTGVHCYVHLKEKNYWSTLKDTSITHDEFMQRCNLHLAYLGNNTYLELVLRTASVSYNIFGIDQPLDLTESAPAVIGTLSCAETSTLDMLLKLEGGRLDNTANDSIPLPKEWDPKQRTIPINKKDDNPDMQLNPEDSDSTIGYDYIDQLKENTLNINNELLDVYTGTQVNTQEEKTSSKTVTSSLTNTNESRKLRKRTQKMSLAISRKKENTSTKLEYYDSDSTIYYDYTDEINENISNLRDEPVDVYPVPQTKTQEEHASAKIVTSPPISVIERRKLTLRKSTQKQRRPLIEATIQKQNIIITRHKNSKSRQSTKKSTNEKLSKTKGNSSATSKTHKFAITSHGLLRKKRKKYKFICPITVCKKIFHTVKEWNCHHLSLHNSVKYQCGKCLKWVTTPNRFADHQYYHQEARYKCGRCNKTFHFNSGLQLHKNKHRRTKAYKCFAKNCGRNYKWPQDLLRHVKIHRQMRWYCEYCDYTSNEIRLLRQHKRTHLDIKKYICRRSCNDSFKHAMQRYRHEKRCQ